jgi:hypothetical protein
MDHLPDVDSQPEGWFAPSAYLTLNVYPSKTSRLTWALFKRPRYGTMQGSHCMAMGFCEAVRLASGEFDTLASLQNAFAAVSLEEWRP